VECVGLLLNILSLSGLCLLCDGSVEEHQEFIIAGGVVGLVTYVSDRVKTGEHTSDE
jgi:hypothetical protein